MRHLAFREVGLQLRVERPHPPQQLGATRRMATLRQSTSPPGRGFAYGTRALGSGGARTFLSAHFLGFDRHEADKNVRGPSKNAGSAAICEAPALGEVKNLVLLLQPEAIPL